MNINKSRFTSNIIMSEKEVSTLRKFNNSVRGFVAELRRLFDENDEDIIVIESIIEMSKLNARVIIGPFQRYVLVNTELVKNIMSENTNFFLVYQFEELVNKNRSYTEYGYKLISKFRDALLIHQNDPKTVKNIFDWFKILVYYAANDSNVDMDQFLTTTNKTSNTICTTDVAAAAQEH